MPFSQMALEENDGKPKKKRKEKQKEKKTTQNSEYSTSSIFGEMQIKITM